jgi:uncharacterized membrane protein YcaP (DUF421 family)
MTSEIQPFDVQRMFFGDLPALFILEVAFRTSFMYLYTLAAARLIGKRGMGQLTPFEYIIVIALGSATGDPMFYPEVPLIHGIVVITSIVLLEKLLARLTQTRPRLEDALESVPTLLIKNGKIIEDSLQKSELSRQELFMQLRMNKIRNVGEVERAFLEPSGRISVFTHHANTAGEETFPEDT